MLLATKSVPDVLVFVAAAAITIGGALGVVAARNPIHSALNLIATLVGIAIAFVEESANFLAAAQVIVYAGAIVILFLFVIMFLGVDRAEDLSFEPLVGQRPLALCAAGTVGGGLIALMAAGGWSSGARSVVGPVKPGQDVTALGRAVFTTYLFAFEATALLLIIAVVGAVVLARRTAHRPDRAVAPRAQGDAPPSNPDASADAGAEAVALADAEEVAP